MDICARLKMKVEAFLLILIIKDICAGRSKIVVHPKNITAKDCQEEVRLRCVFETPIEQCSWQRNGSALAISERYKFTDSSKGRNSTDCSIIIREPEKIDEGYWTCSDTVGATHDTVGIRSERAYLKVQCENCDGCLESPKEFPSTPDNNEKVDTVIIAVAAIGGIVVIIIIIIGIIVYWQCRKKKRKTCEHGPYTAKPVPENIRYREHAVQPMLLLQQGQYNFPPGLGSNIHPSMIGMIPPQPVNHQQYQTLTTGQYLMPVAISPASLVPDGKLNQPAKEKSTGGKLNQYENILEQVNHVYDEIELI